MENDIDMMRSIMDKAHDDFMKRCKSREQLKNAYDTIMKLREERKGSLAEIPLIYAASKLMDELNH